MRTYIFTKKERKAIAGFFSGNVKLGDDIMRQIVLRVRTFRDLASDVETYTRLRKTIGTSPA